MIYVHGYTESLDILSVRTVITAYLTRNDTNIFALDWSNYSTGNYITEAIPHVIGVSQFLYYVKSRIFLLLDRSVCGSLAVLLGREGYF